MRPISKYFDRVIAEADFDYLAKHRPGLARRAKEWRWRIATDDAPTNLTLADFGITLPPEPPEVSRSIARSFDCDFDDEDGDDDDDERLPEV